MSNIVHQNNSVANRGKPTLAEIKEFQKFVVGLPQFDEFVTNHYFANGMYCRELFIPKGITIIGKTYKFEHFLMVTKGKLNIVTEHDGLKTVKAGDIFVSKPNTKRVIYALKSSALVNIHRTDKTDLDEIEKEIIEEEDQAALFDFDNKLKNRLEA